MPENNDCGRSLLCAGHRTMGILYFYNFTNTTTYRRWEALFSLVSLALRLLLLHVMANDTDDSGEFIYMPNP